MEKIEDALLTDEEKGNAWSKGAVKREKMTLKQRAKRETYLVISDVICEYQHLKTLKVHEPLIRADERAKTLREVADKAVALEVERDGLWVKFPRGCIVEPVSLNGLKFNIKFEALKSGKSPSDIERSMQTDTGG